MSEQFGIDLFGLVVDDEVCDAVREVADSFEVVVDFDDRKDHPQVDGYGREQCEKVFTLPIHGQFVGIDQLFAAGDLVREFFVTGEQCGG